MDNTKFIDNAGKALADEIDWNILANELINDGWAEVYVDNYHCKYRDGMAEWIYDNIKGNKTGFRGRWLFKSASDANWFALRWL